MGIWSLLHFCTMLHHGHSDNDFWVLAFSSGQWGPQSPWHPAPNKCAFVSPCRDPMEKAMAPHSSTLAWKMPWMEEPGRLQSMGSLRVRHDWATSLSLFTFMHWRRKWQPTPLFLPGESLLSMGSHRVGHDWSDLAAAAKEAVNLSS